MHRMWLGGIQDDAQKLTPGLARRVLGTMMEADNVG